MLSKAEIMFSLCSYSVIKTLQLFFFLCTYWNKRTLYCTIPGAIVISELEENAKRVFQIQKEQTERASFVYQRYVIKNARGREIWYFLFGVIVDFVFQRLPKKQWNKSLGSVQLKSWNYFGKSQCFVDRRQYKAKQSTYFKLWVLDDHWGQPL